MKHLEMERSGAASRRRASARAAEPSEARRFRPVMLWAAIGVGALVLQIVAFTGWVVSGDFKATPPGPTPVPGWMHVTIRSWEVLSVPASLLILYFFLIRPWRRHGHITLDGMFCLAAFTIFWQDTFINFFQVQVVYNSGFVNRGSWYPHVLGWLSPNTNRISTSLIGFAPGGYLYFWFGMMVVGCWIMRKVKQRWPQLGTFGLIMTCLAFFIAFDAVAEPLWMRLGYYSYPGGISWLTFFHGHYYQYPIYIGIFGGVWWCAYTSLRYFRNDKGETWAERGLSEMRVRPRTRTLVRFLAVVGACNVCFMSSNIPLATLGLYQSPWVTDVTSRSYFTDGMCGPGTTYACPGPGVPIPRPGSAHLSPDGNLVKP